MNAVPAATRRQFVTFRIDGDLFGFDIRIVKEVHPQVLIAPVPLAPPHIRGLVNIRGQIVLVMDPAIILGHPPRPVTGDSHLIIIKTAQEMTVMHDQGAGMSGRMPGTKPVAFQVDAIGDVIGVESTSIDAVPPHIAASIGHYLEGVVREGDELLIIMEAGNLAV